MWLSLEGAASPRAVVWTSSFSLSSVNRIINVCPLCVFFFLFTSWESVVSSRSDEITQTGSSRIVSFMCNNRGCIITRSAATCLNNSLFEGSALNRRWTLNDFLSVSDLTFHPPTGPRPFPSSQTGSRPQEVAERPLSQLQLNVCYSAHWRSSSPPPSSFSAHAHAAGGW